MYFIYFDFISFIFILKDEFINSSYEYICGLFIINNADIKCMGGARIFYLFPFLIIFAIVFAILQKTKIFGDSQNNSSVKGVNAIIAVSIGFFSLNDHVSLFCRDFPLNCIGCRFVLLILIGFFHNRDRDGKVLLPSW